MVFVALLMPGPAWAGTGGADMPWNIPFQLLLANLTGPTARVMAGFMIVIGGLVWGFTRHEDGVKRIGQAIFAIAIMFGAVQIVALLQFAGATV
jgi:type IV secretion system protein VirB2